MTYSLRARLPLMAFCGGLAIAMHCTPAQRATGETIARFAASPDLCMVAAHVLGLSAQQTAVECKVEVAVASATLNGLEVADELHNRHPDAASEVAIARAVVDSVAVARDPPDAGADR